MDIENLAKELILKNMTPEQQMAVLESVRQSVANAKEVQKKKIGENVDLVVQALKKIESDIRDRFDAVGNSIEKRVLSIQDGRDGANGKDGRDGKDGKSGRDGLKGDRGVDGQAGRDGVDGVDGISVVNAQIDFDGSLVITLSDGRELNVGEVVSQDIAEKIKVISTMSTNGAVGIKDEGTSISTGVKTINFVGAAVTATNSGDDVTVNVSAGTGTVTSVAATAGTGISITGSPITTSGTLNITNTAPDQTVALTQGGTTTITGTYPNFTISSADQFQGTVTSVTGTSPVASTGGATPAISLAASYGDTQNPYASKTANFVLAAPNGSAGVPTFRAVVAADIPTLNQSTTGSAATLTTARAIYGNNFNGSAALTQIIASTYGGTGNGFTKFTGATTAEKTYTLPDASSTIVVQGGALGTPSSGTVTNLTGTASININGTVGATTAAAGTFTTATATDFKSSGNYTIEYQLIAGGGGGSASAAGGGGGGITQGGLSVTPTTGYTVTIGAAGAIASTGGDTSLTGATTAKGGGAAPAGVGGSSAGNTDNAAPSARTAGTSNQGNAGGNGTSGTVGGGGGGGAGSPGGDGSSSSGYGGLGGAGILGFDGNFYSGGGGGSGQNGIAFGGNGGGGNGGKNTGPAATSGGTNTGGGGGGSYATAGASGGSGKTIIRYFGAQRGTGGTVSSVGGWTYHVFTSSGTFTA